MAITDPLDVRANGFLKVCKHRPGERRLHVSETPSFLTAWDRIVCLTQSPSLTWTLIHLIAIQPSPSGGIFKSLSSPIQLSLTHTHTLLVWRLLGASACWCVTCSSRFNGLKRASLKNTSFETSSHDEI